MKIFYSYHLFYALVLSFGLNANSANQPSMQDLIPDSAVFEVIRDIYVPALPSNSTQTQSETIIGRRSSICKLISKGNRSKYPLLLLNGHKIKFDTVTYNEEYVKINLSGFDQDLFIQCNNQGKPLEFSYFKFITKFSLNFKQPCGLSGSITQRISECEKIEDITYKKFDLVSRTVNGDEIFYDKENKLLWSDSIKGANGFVKHTTLRAGNQICSDPNTVRELFANIDKKWRLPKASEFKSASAILDLMHPNLHYQRRYGGETEAASIYNSSEMMTDDPNNKIVYCAMHNALEAFHVTVGAANLCVTEL